MVRDTKKLVISIPQLASLKLSVTFPYPFVLSEEVDGLLCFVGIRMYVV